MKQINRSQLAPFGLYLSLIAALASFSLYILQKQFTLALQISLGLTIIGLALFAVLDPGRVRTAFTGRQARYGSNTLVMILAFIGILVVINLVIFNHSKRWDLTQDKSHTLAPETLQTLNKLPQPVTALAFYSNNVSSDSTRSLLEDFKASSGGKFNYKFINPDQDPVAAHNASITQDATVVVEMGQQKAQLTSITETDLTAALIRLANPGERIVYFLSGHGELGLSGTANQAISQVKSTLETKNYTVKELALLVDRQIPADALAIIIAGPLKPVSTDEVKLLQAYLDKGGSLVVMEEPTFLTQFGNSPDPLADYLSQNWGVTLGNDMIVDLTANPPSVAVANEYGSHVITSKLNNTVTIFPTCRSVQTKPVEGITQTILVKTSTRSWAETNLTDLQNNIVAFDQNTDLAGPVPLAVAAENSTNNGRVVVFGDSEFASDAYFSSYGNGDLIINSIDWAAKEDQLINLTPKQTTQRILIPPQNFTLGMVFLGFVIGLPGLVIFSGILVWVQKKRRG